MAFEEEQPSRARIVLNLVGDTRFTHVINEAVAEICGRYKRFPSMPELMDDAIHYASQFSSQDLIAKTKDGYHFGPQKKGGINLTPAMHKRLTELMVRLNEANPGAGERWTRRKLGVAALYAYCRHVIENNGKEL